MQTQNFSHMQVIDPSWILCFQFARHYLKFWALPIKFYSLFFSLINIKFVLWHECIQQVNRLEITPNKQYLAAAGNPHIRLFDVNSSTPQPVGFILFLKSILLSFFFFSSLTDGIVLLKNCKVGAELWSAHK